MTQATASVETEKQTHLQSSKEFLTILIAGQLFGIPILQVQDVLGEQEVTKVLWRRRRFWVRLIFAGVS